MNLKGIQRTSKWQLRDSSRERLSNSCRALSKENAELLKLVEEKTKNFSQKKFTVQLRQEIDQLEKDNRLNEMDINKPQKYSVQSTKYSDPTGDANQVRNNSKRKKKTDRQEDYMEVEVSHIINKDKSGAELQVDKDRIKLPQDEPGWMKASHNEITLRYETDVINARRQVVKLMSLLWDSRLTLFMSSLMQAVGRLARDPQLEGLAGHPLSKDGKGDQCQAARDHR